MNWEHRWSDSVDDGHDDEQKGGETYQVKIWLVFGDVGIRSDREAVDSFQAKSGSKEKKEPVLSSAPKADEE